MYLRALWNSGEKVVLPRQAFTYELPVSTAPPSANSSSQYQAQTLNIGVLVQIRSMLFILLSCALPHIMDHSHPGVIHSNKARKMRDSHL